MNLMIQNLTQISNKDLIKIKEIAFQAWPFQDVVEAIEGEINASINIKNQFIVLPKFIIAKIKDEIVGFSCWQRASISFDTWELSWLAVDENHRHKGIATKMLDARIQEIAKDALKNDCEIATVIVKTANHKVYQDRGFKPLFQGKNWNPKKHLLVAEIHVH